MTILVTGATGFLGGAVARSFLGRGRRVIASGRNPRALADLAEEGAEPLFWELDQRVDDAWRDRHERQKDIRTVVHCAARSAPFGRYEEFQRDNVLATWNVAQLAAGLEVDRIIYISTPAIYFRPRDQWQIREDDPLPRPVNAYARTKFTGERIVAGVLGKRVITLRPRGIYGRGDTALIPRLVRAASSGPLPLMRGGRAVTDLTHVDDVVSAILHAEAAPPSVHGPFNISGGEDVRLRTLIDTVCFRLETPVRWKPTPVPVAMTAATAMEAWASLRRQAEPRATRYSLGLLAYSQTLDITRASRELGWRPHVRIGDGLVRTLYERR